MRILLSLYLIAIASINICSGLAAASDRQILFSSTDSLMEKLTRIGEQEISTVGRLSCGTCTELAKNFHRLSRVDRSHKYLIGLSKQICIRFNLLPREMCESTVEFYGPWLLQVVKNDRFDADKFCGMSGKCDRDPSDWDPVFPKDKPAIRQRAVGLKRKYVLHLSDWHFDSEYQVGLEADCDEPLCCRPLYGHVQPFDIKKPAGMFGEYKCDTPAVLASSVLAKARELYPNYDFVIMTGDLPPHDIWATSHGSVVEAERVVADDLHASFSNITVYMAIGNHEADPPNSFPSFQTPDSDITWLYKSLADQWRPWLPDSSTSTFTKFGYYSTVRAKDNLRIISLNTNFSYLMNWWIFVAEIDPDNMLHWLIDQLQQAEDLQQDVYIVGHIPPGSHDVASSYSMAFNKIVRRYNDTIVAQFYGHKHTDLTEIFYDDVETREIPIGVAYVGPSITPFTDLNPGFRVYEVDVDTNIVTNHFTWVLDLQASNEKQEAVWVQEYDALSAFEMKSLSPVSWHEVTLKMEREEKDEGGNDFLEKYIMFKSKMVVSKVECDSKCRKQQICAIRTSQSFTECIDHDKREFRMIDGNLQLVLGKVQPTKERDNC